MNSNANSLYDEQSYDDSGLEDANAPALPPEVFKNGRVLKHALDQLSKVAQHQPSAIASLIAHTVHDLPTDYATKLDLINSAIHHSFFKPTNYLKYYFSMIALRAHLAMNYVFNAAEHPYLPDCLKAERILQQAKKALRDSKSKLILC